MQFPNPNLDPEYETFGKAVEHATRLANEMQVAHTIVAECSDHKLGFHSFASEAYASLREKGLTSAMAPVASILPNGTIDVYDLTLRSLNGVLKMRKEQTAQAVPNSGRASARETMQALPRRADVGLDSSAPSEGEGRGAQALPDEPNPVTGGGTEEVRREP